MKSLLTSLQVTKDSVINIVYYLWLQKEKGGEDEYKLPEDGGTISPSQVYDVSI